MPRSFLSQYAVATAAVAISIAARYAVAPWLGESVPYLQFYPAIMVAAWYGGFGPGMWATALSAAAAAYWYLPPYYSFWIRSSSDILAWCLFIAVGAVISRLTENLRRAEAEQRRTVDRLRDEYSALAGLAQSQLAALVESSDDAIIGKNLNSEITAWNEGAERLFGYTAAEAIGKPITLIIPDDRLDEEDRVIARVRAGQRVRPFETFRRRKDGALVPVAVTVSPIRSPSGAIIGASKIVRDITEQRRAAQQREELLARERIARAEATAARDRLQFLVEVSELLASSLDYEATLERAVHIALPRLGDYCNVLVADDQGWLRHAAWGHVVPDKEPLVHELAVKLLDMSSTAPTFAREIVRSNTTIVANHETLLKAMSRVEQYDREVLALAAHLRPYAYVGAPLQVRGRAIGVMSFGRTEQESCRDYDEADVALVEEFARRVSLAIENARLFRKADQLNRLKDEFLATVSHELRTPLSAILGWARLLSTGSLNEEKARRAIIIIERNALAQTKLVDDILDVARGISGNLRLDLKPVDFVAVAQRGVEAVAPAAASKKIDVDLQATSGVTVAGDAVRLQQVVWNLLSNAVKFTPQGGRVEVKVRTADGLAELEVADTGPGIPSEFLPYIFDKFRQGDSSFTREHGGLGLGLAIARHIVELHGGSIEARSEGEGRGATFSVKLPVAEP